MSISEQVVCMHEQQTHGTGRDFTLVFGKILFLRKLLRHTHVLFKSTQKKKSQSDFKICILYLSFKRKDADCNRSRPMCSFAKVNTANQKVAKSHNLVM